MRWFLVVVSLSALVLTMSCASSYESKGNQAYKAAQRASGDAKRLLQKEAYIYYRKAMKAHPDRIGRQLRNRFVEMTLARAAMVLVEGSSNMEALPLFLEDLDSAMSADVEPFLRNQFADFCILLADSNFANQRLYKGLDLVEKSVKVASDPEPYKKRRESVISSLAKDNFEIAKMEYENGLAEKDHEALIRAEFRAKLAMYYDPQYPGAADLLSKLYQADLSYYSAYEAVVTDKPDSNIYDQINRYTILLAIPDVTRGGLSVTAIVNMYNYSYNPLRLRAEDFAIVDENGQVCKASTSSNLGKEILDQEMEVKMTLRFGCAGGRIEKLTYDNGEQYTEKVFF